MSVINQMLRELDRQTARPGAQLPAGAQAVPDRPRRRWPIYASLVGALALAGGLWQSAPPLGNPATPRDSASAKTPAAAVAAPQTPLVQATVATPAANTAPRTPQAPAPALPQAPVAAPTPRVKRPELSQEELSTEELAQDSETETEETRPEEPEFEATQSRPVLQKTVSAGPTARAERQYQAALSALDEGRGTDAEHALAEALSLDPQHAGALAELAALYLQQGRPQAAEALLLPALAQAPDEPVWRLLLARAKLAGGDPEAAYQMLAARVPALVGYNDYHATLAALEQQLGHHDAAAGRYAALVREDANQAAWWLGLGLALDARGRGGDAIAAYRRALDLNQLGGAARAHAEQRVAAGG